MTEYENQTFSHQTIRLAGRHFRRCRFEHCALDVQGTAPIGVDAWIFAGCQLEINGPAAVTIEILSFLAHDPGGAPWVERIIAQIRGGARNQTPPTSLASG